MVMFMNPGLSFSLSQTMVGLEILNDRISAVVLRKNRKKWTVHKTDKKRILEASSNIGAHKITEFFNELDVKAKQVITSFSGEDAIVKILKLPPLQRKGQELPELMQYELENQLPIPLSEAAYDYQIIQPKERIDVAGTQTPDETIVLLAAVRRSKLNDHLALMENAGISPTAVMPSFLTVFNTLLACGLLSPHEPGFVGIVRLSESVVDIIVVEHGVLSLARSFAPKAEEPYGILRELQNTLRVFLNPTSENKLEKLIIVTEEESLPFALTMDRLTDALAFPECEHHQISDGFAMGLVTGNLNIPHTISLNLLKPLLNEWNTKQKIERKERLLRLGTIAATLVLAATATFLFYQTKIAQNELTEEKATQQFFEQKVQNIATLEKKLEPFQRQIEALRWVDAGYPSLSYRLYQVGMSTIQNIWLKDVSVPQQPRKKKDIIPVMESLIVTGYALSQADIDNFTQQLRKLDCFSEVQQENTEEKILVNKKQVLLFQLLLKSKPANINE